MRSALTAGTDHGSLIVRDPEDGSVIGEIAETTRNEVESALQRGYLAQRSPPPATHERAGILAAVADKVQADFEEHAQLIAREGVKTIREARAEVLRTVETLRLSGEEAKRLGGEVLAMDQFPSGEGRLGWWCRRPAGLVVAITPYNDPLNLVAHKIGPAFAVGAPILLKPHPQTPFSAIRLVEHFRAAGAPVDRLQIVIGGTELGQELVADPRPRAISFTGGRAAGEAICRRAGMKRLMLELGGVGVVAVAADADIERAANAIHSGAFWAAGQNCVRAQRVIADKRVVGELTDRLLDAARAMNLGSKRDEATDMGPMVDSEAAASMLAVVSEARRGGVTVLTGGTGNFTKIAPTWLTDLSGANNNLRQQELFGPVSTIETVENDQEIVSYLSECSDTIHTALFTRSIGMALKAFDASNSGAVIINDSTDFRIDAMPFGGNGRAGLGREGVRDAIHELSVKKLMVMRP